MSRRLPLLLCLIVLSGCGEEEPGAFQGYVDADYLRIGAPQAGWLERVTVTEGQRIAAGDQLFALDATNQRAAVAQTRAELAQAESQLADLRIGARPEEIASIEAQIAASEATLNLARITLERQQRLAATQVAAQAQLDEARANAAQAEAQRNKLRADLALARLPARADRIAAAVAAVDAARAAVEQAEWALDQRVAYSPAAGVVDDVVSHPGEWVPTSGTVISLLPDDAIKVVFFVPEARRSAIHPGSEVSVTCTGCPDGLTAHISRVATEAEYTPPVIFSRETAAKLVWRVEGRLAPMERTPTPGQPVTVRTR
jgi:HlyD family secretion protein